LFKVITAFPGGFLPSHILFNHYSKYSYDHVGEFVKLMAKYFPIFKALGGIATVLKLPLTIAGKN
jgi:hypothetical protein